MAHSNDYSQELDELMEEGERWTYCEAPYTRYAVTSFGKVYSLKGRFGPKTISIHQNNRGHVVIGLSDQGSRRTFCLHTLVAQAFVTRGSGKEVGHLDGDPKNCSADNLYWQTSEQRCYERAQRGNWPNRKLSQSQAEEIRRRYDAEKITQVQLAEEYGLSHTCVQRIVKGDAYKEPKHLR